MLQNPNIQTVDVVLTDIGRKYLAEGSPNFRITRWACADDEIDYNLFDTSQASSDNYGQLIKAMPLFEASTFSATGLRYKLVTLPAGTTKIPILKVEPTSMTVYENQEVIITPSILNYTLTAEQMSFTAVLRNSNLGTLSVNEQVGSTTNNMGTNSSTINQTLLSNIATTTNTFVSTDSTERVVTVIGKSFRFRAAADVSNIDSNSRVTTIEIFGNVVGGGESIPVTVVHSDAVASNL